MIHGKARENTETHKEMHGNVQLRAATHGHTCSQRQEGDEAGCWTERQCERSSAHKAAGARVGKMRASGLTNAVVHLCVHLLDRVNS
eukprot:5327481-Pleurochrysis_carterae.AAC.4